mgnify:CR=1 FL=1
MMSLGLNHQSNGRSQPYSRSWNRLTAQVGIERGDFALVLRPWYRFPEKDGKDASRYAHLAGQFGHMASELAKPLQRTRVVVTHHYPSPRSTAAEYEGEPANGAFGSALGRDFFENTHLWIHGHTHTSFDYLEHGCRVVCNPRGYLRRGGHFENGQFDPGLLLTVNAVS